MNTAETLYYFAYGQTIHPDELQKALPEGTKVKVLGRAYLPGYRIVFGLPAPEGAGFLPTLVRFAAGRVWGGLYELPASVRPFLDVAEGAEAAFSVGRFRTVYSYAPPLFSLKPEQFLDEKLYKKDPASIRRPPIQLFESYVMVDGVLAYESSKPDVVSGVPSARCLQKMAEGARLHKMPDRYVQELERQLDSLGDVEY